MAEHAAGRIFALRLVYVALAAGVFYVALLPLDAGPGRWPGPDVLLCLTMAWVIRRPAYVPTLLIAAVFLCADLLLMRPPGLAAAINLIAVEFLRSRVIQLRTATFVQEWVTVSVMIAAAALVFRFAQWMAVLPNPLLVQDIAAIAFTIAIYPVIVWLSAWLLSVRKVAHGEVGAEGGVA